MEDEAADGAGKEINIVMSELVLLCYSIVM